MEDNKLLRLLHKDPNAGMEQLMNQYTGLVYAVVKSKLDDSYYVSSDIEDCVADVFSKFYAELSDYDPTRLEAGYKLLPFLVSCVNVLRRSECDSDNVSFHYVIRQIL